MDIFLGGFYLLAVFCTILYLWTRAALPPTNDAAFNSFQRTYLTVYLMAMGGDWLQGPHVYALYESYGMTTNQIDILFVAGFGSSMVLGTIIGSFADKYGRLLGGAATSMLYSAFESWLVYEHHKRGFDSNLLGNIFSLGVLGNSVVAIVAGLVAQKFADAFGFVAPFDVSMVVLLLMVVVIVATWSENYGDQSTNVSQSFQAAIRDIRDDPKVLCLGLIQSLFEGSMYCFVLEWTPTLSLVLEPKADGSGMEKVHMDIPHGHIFAAFMVSLMIGSSIFKLLDKYTSIESFMRVVLLIAAFSLTMPIFFQGNQLFIFIGFLVFETCVGIFWPSMGTMRGKYVAEETRATTMNIFRIPLNMIVVLILLQHLNRDYIYICCTVFLLGAALFQHWLYRLSRKMASPAIRLGDKADELRTEKSVHEKRHLVDEEEMVV